MKSAHTDIATVYHVAVSSHGFNCTVANASLVRHFKLKVTNTNRNEN